MVAPGSTRFEAEPSCESINSASIAVRCCADVDPGAPVSAPVPTPTKAPVIPVPAPTRSPSDGSAVLSTSTCEELGWTNAGSYGTSSVCGNSNVGEGCSGTVGQSEANAFCEAVGARLCTMTELQDNEARGTGCKYDGQMIWTSDVCAGGYMVAPGSNRISTAPSCEAETSFYNTRCCADIFEAVPIPSPTTSPIIPVPAPSRSPNAASTGLSTSTCDELGWTNAGSYGSSSVCGESKVGGLCSGTISQSEANAFCEAAGARLCTIAELQANEARGTGCKYDVQLVWTADECSEGYYVASGSTRLETAPSCEASATEMYARCCADAVAAD